ncbi:MAG: HEAT repeat domain-containing protein [Deltaproteobacteria bacterium]|nr:HEAT repeat domain-containing protein [Deltaproteobacteria bacterium]
MKIEAALFTVALVIGAVALTPEASACGYWQVEDEDLVLSVMFLIGHTRVSFPGAGSVLLGNDYLPQRLELTDEAVIHLHERVGQLDEDRVTLGEQTYVLQIGSAEETKCGVGSVIRVKHGERLIVDKRLERRDTKACEWRRKGDVAPAIKKRLVLYLIWRQKFLEDVRQKIVSLPVNRVEAARQLTAELDGRSNYKRTVATRALVELGANAVPALTEKLVGNNGRRARFALVHALLNLGDAASSAAPDLLDVLETRNVSLKRLVCRALGTVGQGDQVVAEALIELAGHRNPKTRAAAAQALGSLGVDPGE